MGIRDGPGGFCGWVVHAIARFLQLVFALAVAGLYGVDLNNWKQQGVSTDNRWVYAEVCAGLSAVTCMIYMIPFLKTYYMFAWDAVLFILWTALFGIFGKLYINQNADGNGDVQRMKNAVWIDLVNMILWFITAIYAGLMFLSMRRGKTLHTGRAEV